MTIKILKRYRISHFSAEYIESAVSLSRLSARTGEHEHTVARYGKPRGSWINKVQHLHSKIRATIGYTRGY